MFQNPSIQDFKNYFSRDFPYGIDPELNIVDQDIANAFMFCYDINQNLFSTQENYTLGFLLLAAHNLVLSIRQSSQGLSSGFGNWNETSKGVGGINQSFSIPQPIIDNPSFSHFNTTLYGQRYFSLIYNATIGYMYSVEGQTKP